MASAVTLSISTKDQSGIKHTTNVSYVNPQATNEQLKEFALMLVALTYETYEGATKITKESVI